MSTGQQVTLAILLILGNPILVSIFTLAFRKHVFEKRFQDIIRADRERMKPTGAVVGMAGAMFGLPVMSNFRSFNKESKPSRTSIQGTSPPILGGVGSHLQEPRHAAQTMARSPDIRVSGSNSPRRPDVDVEAGKSPFLAPPSGSTGNTPQLLMSPGGRSITFLEPIREGTDGSTGLGVSQPSPNLSGGHSHGSPEMTRRKSPSNQENRTASRPEQPGFNINSFLRANKAQIGRNGQFFNLTAQEREYLGGVEYRAIKLLIVAVTCYFVAFQVLGAITLGAWIAVHETSATQLNAQNPWWAGIFLAISAFNNGGIGLLDAGISAFLSSYFLLVVVTCLMLAGSAAFPVFLRLGLWLLAQGLKYGTRETDYPVLKETLSFTLKYPRRVYTMLFPSKATWYLFAMLVGFVAVDWVLILTLSLGNTVITSIPVGQRVFDVLFQSICKFEEG